MKSKISQWWARVKEKRAVAAVLAALKAVWGLFSNNLGLKVLSLLMAVLLWNFVVSSNSSITRTKTIEDLTGYISGQTTLNDTYGLALLDNPADELADISVVVEVAQSQYSRVSSDNVQVTLDLSSVRTAGTQEVALKASTSYGRVVRIIPDKLSLTFEALDSRTIPVNVQLGGNAETDWWYRVNRTNPSSLTVSGAASVVQSIARASVYVDVEDAEETFIAAERYTLLDSAGNAIPQTMLNRSSTSVSVSVEVYPSREVPIATEIDKVTNGQPAEGYEVVSVTVQPETLVVAAEKDLLDSVTELNIEPIDVEGLSQSFAVRAAVSALSSFKSVSAEQVYVYVTIAEETAGAWIEDVKVSYINKDESLSLTRTVENVRVYVTGPRSDIETLQEAGFVATVDLKDLRAGSYTLDLGFPQETYPDVTFAPEIGEVEFKLSPKPEETN